MVFYNAFSVLGTGYPKHGDTQITGEAKAGKALGMKSLQAIGEYSRPSQDFLNFGSRPRTSRPLIVAALPLCVVSVLKLLKPPSYAGYLSCHFFACKTLPITQVALFCCLPAYRREEGQGLIVRDGLINICK